MYALYYFITTYPHPSNAHFAMQAMQQETNPLVSIMYKEKKKTIPLPSTSIDMYNELRTPCSDEYIHRILYKQRDLSTLSSHYSDSNEGERKEKIGISCAISQSSLAISRAPNLASSQARS
jgi:hypothetical protein